MWGSWASDRAHGARSSVAPFTRFAALALLLGGLGVASATSARVRVDASVKDHAGITRHVRITDSGVHVDGADADSDTTILHLGRSVRIGGGRVVVDDNGTGMVRLFSDARVEKGERVDGDVVAVFGSVHIDGEVTGAAVAVFGSVELGPGAVVGGDAVAVGGPLDAERGRVGGQSVSVGILPLTLGLPALPVVLAFLGLGWLLALVIGSLFGAIFPERLAHVAETSSPRTFLSLVIGLSSVFLVPIAAVLLMGTVVGLPIGLLLLPAHLAIGYLRQLTGAYLLGSQILRRPLRRGAAASPLAR